MKIARAVTHFTCLGDQCPDTCCKGWSMQVDDATLARYRAEAPELLEAVEPSAHAPWIMRKNAAGYCVKFEDGLCGIHKKFGDLFLGDACHFYPRITRALGEETVMTASLSCPEIARLALEEGQGPQLESGAVERLPHGLKNYLPEGMTAEEGLATHEAFLVAAADESVSAETVHARLMSVCRSLEMIAPKDWPRAAPMYLRLADGRLPAAEANPADPFNLLHALAGLMVATQKPMSERLGQTVSEMERSLAVKLDWQNVRIATTEGSEAAWQNLQALWRAEGEAHYQAFLRRYLQMQLSAALFPFAGLGGSLSERAVILGVRLATVKLALMCALNVHGAKLPPGEAVRVAQSLSRFLDHLGDPAFSLQIYAETGWTKEARLRGLLTSYPLSREAGEG